MKIDESYLWTDSSIVLTWIQGPPNRCKTFVGNRVATIQEETASASWRHVPSQSNSADLVSRGVEPTTLSTSTLWWKEPQWLIQKPSSWPKTEVNTPTEHLEMRNMHVALRQHPEDFIHQSCCLLQKIYQQLQAFQGQANHHSVHTRCWPGSDLLCKDGTTNFLYTRNLGLDGTRSCIYQFSQDTTSIHWSGRSSQNRRTTTTVYSSLSSNASDDFALKSSLYKIGCLSRTYMTSFCWATTFDSITTWKILDIKNQELGKISHSSVPNLL